ncbi:MAG: hypothetical protein HOH43_21700 [Candidatus Latescibacteria bacterium]|nr:hypothetical protein [Candidatus Latescibacterota bacterium]
MAENEESYIDAKGRQRWSRNDKLGRQLQMLYDILVIGGYDESHARRYPQLAYTISRHHESIQVMMEEGRLTEIPGIGGVVGQIITEFLKTGTCSKLEEWAEGTPRSVLDLTEIPGLGAKTVGTLYRDHGIDGLETLKAGIEDGTVDGIKGIGKKMVEKMRQTIADREE